MLFPISSRILNYFCRLLFHTSILFFPTPAFSSHCIHDHFSALLTLKLGFNFSENATLSSWNPNNTNCCTWEAITCDDATGRVTGLDLSYYDLWGTMDFHSLFRIRSLQKLNLAATAFYPSPIPSGFDKLTDLSHLNLSHSLSFYGQIPPEISRLTGLVSLDLSSYGNFMLKNPNLQALVRNLSSLRELLLDGIDIGMTGSEWGEALSSSLPSLQKLSFSDCNLSGPIPSSLSKLHSLSVLDLRFIGNFSWLESLNLAHCQLHGKFPQNILDLPNLRTLNLRDNMYLTGYLAQFPPNNSLKRG